MKQLYYFLLGFQILLNGCGSKSKEKQVYNDVQAKGDGLETIFISPDSIQVGGYAGKYLKVKNAQCSLTASEEDFEISITLEATDSTSSFQNNGKTFELFLNLTDEDGNPSPNFDKFTCEDSNTNQSLKYLFQNGKGEAFVKFVLHQETKADVDFSLKDNNLNARYRKDKFSLKRKLEQYKNFIKHFKIYSVQM
ncbi:MAG: hypothetical protein MUF58_06865 [Arcicella sp.]|jgi:hypothetical protein|nr:hypothetical protein [Arcicella sp.]